VGGGNIAGITLMEIAKSAPELFTNLIATFITKGDVGIGTIAVSAVFNILAVAVACGLGAGMASFCFLNISSGQKI